MESMLHYATEQSISNGLEISLIQWIPGVMEIPLTVNRMIAEQHRRNSYSWDNRGETQHGAVMGQAVISSIINFTVKI